jgi:hypothetical protein
MSFSIGKSEKEELKQGNSTERLGIERKMRAESGIDEIVCYREESGPV